jgi:hypothetical protein
MTLLFGTLVHEIFHTGDIRLHFAFLFQLKKKHAYKFRSTKAP